MTDFGESSERPENLKEVGRLMRASQLQSTSQPQSIREENILSQRHDDYMRELVRSVRQRHYLRDYFGIFALFFAVIMICLGTTVVLSIMTSESDPGRLVFLALVPIASATLITIAGLFAVFSSPRRDDIAETTRSTASVISRAVGGG